ncbi:MAG: mannose-6-phosphate isomerase [Opitutaceae bacterium]|nr:mannose-6-phosphate isomerase [Opitutaceae bacterium]
MREVLRFQPLYQERVWGGRGLEDALGRTLPPGRPIGESWEIVDRPEAQSVVRGGPLAGQTLRALLTQHPVEIMGPGWPAGKPFPILVKWLDCHERLSLQVHPPAGVAAELHGEPKTEHWFIAEIAAGAHIIAGLKRGVGREQFEQAIWDRTVDSCVHRFPVAAGDSILVPSGRLHAIDAGNLILEIQQNSDTTYRVYDWGRMGLEGKPRPLHVAESLRCILWDDFEPAPQRAAPTSSVIADCPEFLIRRLVLGKGERLIIAAGEQPRLLSVVAGCVSLMAKAPGDKPVSDEIFARGDNLLLPYAGEFVFQAPDAAMVLMTENLAG